MSEWWKPAQAKDLQAVPWMHPAVIAYLETLVRPDWNVLEHGSGGSTLWLASRCAHVTAIEQDEVFFKALRGRVPANVKLLLQRAGSVPAELGQGYDLLLIDGNPVEDRALYLKQAAQLVTAGGWVVLDNANRPEYAEARAEMQRRAAEYFTVSSAPPPTKYLVTELYKLRG